MIRSHQPPKDMHQEAAPPPSLDARANLLLIDLGNSRVGMTNFVDGRATPAAHVAPEQVEAVDGELRRLWSELPADAARAVVICSVCPPMLTRIEAVCQAAGIAPCYVIGRDIPLPIPADLPAPEKVGTDRICAAAAAAHKLKRCCVVADFGTALTIDLVADNQVFLGGTIMPGMQLAARALHEHTALLPMIEVAATEQVLGKDTASAIRNGIFAMMCGALREVTERYATDIGKWPVLVVTGGDGPAVASACDFVDHVVPDLCLEGIALAYRRAAGLDLLTDTED